MKLHILTGNTGSHEYITELNVTSNESGKLRGTYEGMGKKCRITATKKTYSNYKGEKYTRWDIAGKLKDVAWITE